MQTFPGFEAPPKPRRQRRRGPEVATPALDPSDRTFLSDLKRGQSTELAVAGGLDQMGFFTSTPDHNAVPGYISDQADLLVNDKFILEVKGRRFRFRGPWDYCYPTAMVGDVGRWERRVVLPEAVVIVSEVTGAKVAAWTDQKANWVLEKRYDKYRQREVESLAVPRSLLLNWSTFVSQLRERMV